ncbi:MAG: lysylphosphatidylglycerol synthase transmembrane domain-containing protein [Deltaproteobacteria bacterium]
MSRERAPRRAWFAMALRVALASFGLAVIGVLVDRIGVHEVRAAQLRTAPVLPIAFLLDGVRIACDAYSTRLLLGARGREIPWLALFGGHVVGHGVMNVFPAGRSASEAVKAALFHRYLGAAEAVAMGASNQANTLFSSAIFSLACAAAAAVAMPGAALVGAIAIHFAVLFGAGVGMRLAATNPAVEAFFTSRLPRVGAHLSRFAERSRETPIVAWGPVGAMVLGRLAQTFEYGLLASAVGISIGPLEALAVQGVNLVAAAVGVLMPGQLGSSEAIFALASETLGTDEASAMTIALAAHLCALGWAVIGLVLLLAWRASTPRVRAKR